MNTQKNQRKIQIGYKDRGDMMRRSNEHHSPVPRDRGDVRKSLKKVSKQELFKSTTAESVKTDLVSRSTNTFAGSLPFSLENHTINVDVRSGKILDFRKRVKDRYTFKRHQVLKNDDRSQFNGGMQCEVRNDPPKHCFEYVEKQKTKDFRDAKNSDKASVHRAVSAIKFKRSSKPEELARKKSPPETESTNIRHKKPMVKTIKSKTDTRVYKAVTFVERTARKPLHIKMPKDLPKPSKIPTMVPVVKSKTTHTRRQRRSAVPQPSPSFKSADSMPTEIAKWVPESVDQHTKPYYEAWVSKTATASTKLLKEASLEKSKLLRRLELGKRSPELMYKKFAEEEYAGRIRVRRRGDK